MYVFVDLIPKTIGNRKRDCAWGCARGINTTWENLQIEKHKSVRWPQRTPSWFVLFDLQIFSGGVYPRAQPHAQSLFLFPIVFGINLIHFFRWEEGRFHRLFRWFNPLSRHLTEAKLCGERCVLLRRVERFWQRKMWTQRHSRGEKEVWLFGKEKCKTLR